ncbi:MAG: hypothetical protein CMI60_05430 [Parvibaculum sp.]|nr:hypothetical protein [Parvibaculum sp.]|tara:strand:- start:94 stop:561 length:468 start_codon:yes stop_codon:yes gene_type:complete
MTKQEAINRVNEGVGSIYTKEDVTNLINQIEETKVETTDEPQGLRGDIIRYLSKQWDDKGAEIFGDLQMELKNDSIVEMDDCTFTLEYDNKIVLSEVSFDDYEIEDKVDRCSRDLKEWVGATIVEAFTIVEELSKDVDTSIDEQVALGEEQQAEQ